MEQTMGKRIMANRKRLGLTQDQLADRLGVTAQAVSKWENDQSCPDITMLPKLAEIFGISTDELLGRESQTVHQAEIVGEDDRKEQDGLHFQSGDYEFKWDSGNRGGIAFGVWVLLVGVLALANALLRWDVSFWSILWPSALLVFGVFGLVRKFSFFSLGCTLFGGYFLIANLNIWHLELGGKLVFPVILVLFGISLLADALRKPRKPKFTVTHNGKTSGKRERSNHYQEMGDRFECSLAFGENRHLVEIPRLAGGEISCSFGELTVDLTGCEEIADGCALEANCSFGELVLMVPKSCRVDPDSSTAFASLSVSGTPDPSPAAVIRLQASVSFGEISVHYV